MARENIDHEGLSNDGRKKISEQFFSIRPEILIMQDALDVLWGRFKRRSLDD